MAIAAQLHFADSSNGSVSCEISERSLACGQRGRHNLGGARSVSGAPTEPPSIINNRMHTDAAEVRKDVERVLDLYVRIEYFSSGSAAGRIVIDESRVPHRRPKRTVRAPETIEERDAQRITELRRAIYAPPSDPKLDVQGGADLRRVAPLRDVAQVVKPHSRHAVGLPHTDRRTQLWKSTVATKLARMNRACGLCRSGCRHAKVLLEAAAIRVQLEAARNVARVCERDVGSRTRRRRLGELGVRRAEAKRAEAREASSELSSRRISITRSSLYGEALELFYLVCSDTVATRAYVFREEMVASRE